jgi:hypothetical protein
MDSYKGKKISEFLQISENRYIVVLQLSNEDYEDKYNYLHNVYMLEDGLEKWQIKRLSLFQDQIVDCFCDIYFRDDKYCSHTWSGFRWEINIGNGEAIKVAWDK